MNTMNSHEGCSHKWMEGQAKWGQKCRRGAME